LTEQGREKRHESFDKLDELMERWKNRLTLHNLDLVKRYLKVELGVHVHLRQRAVSEVGRDAVEYCAIFQRERVSGTMKSMLCALGISKRLIVVTPESVTPRSAFQTSAIV
jgi:hypothetical protein